jgi:CheY-specific phosphatase CheX
LFADAGADAPSTAASIATCAEATVPAEHDHAVRVRFHGPVRGFIELRATHDVIVAAAMNMLGEDTPLSPEMELDAFGEVANVICGNLLPGIAGADRVFRLEAPFRADARAELFPDACVDLGVDGGRVQVLLVIEENAEAA